MTTPLRGKWVTPPIGNYNKLYSQLCYLQYLLDVIRPYNDFRLRLKKLLSEHCNVDITAMGVSNKLGVRTFVEIRQGHSY